jgi:hypothetical protein
MDAKHTQSVSEYNILTVVEAKRGCGYRKAGKDGVGIYLMGGLLSEVCPRLPFPLTVCPCCGQGVKFARLWTWIEPNKLFDPKLEPQPDYWNDPKHVDLCPMCRPELAEPRAGLLWIGSRNYSPKKFLRESGERGVSRKLASIPHDFVMGETWVYLAHLYVVPDHDDLTAPAKPGVFCVFKPTHIDVVVNTDDPEELPSRAKYLKDKFGDACKLLKVIPDEPTQEELL